MFYGPTSLLVAMYMYGRCNSKLLPQTNFMAECRNSKFESYEATQGRRGQCWVSSVEVGSEVIFVGQQGTEGRKGPRRILKVWSLHNHSLLYTYSTNFKLTSLQRFLRSAPEKKSVSATSFSKETSGPIGMLLVQTFKIESLPWNKTKDKIFTILNIHVQH